MKVISGLVHLAMYHNEPMADWYALESTVSPSFATILIEGLYGF